MREALARIGAAFSAPGASQDAFHDRLYETVRRFPLVADCDTRCLKTLIGEADWMCLPGGVELDRHGDNDRAVFLVVAGCLGVYVADARGEDRLVAHVPAGETVGEMSLITGAGHSARLFAVRDTELLRLSKPAFDKLISREPRVVMNLMRLVIGRLRSTTARAAQQARPKTFALAPLMDGGAHLGVGRALQQALHRMGLSCTVFEPHHREMSPEHLANAEAANDYVLYCGDAPSGAWTKACLRQADRVMLVAHAGQELRALAQLPAREGLRHQPELLVLHEGDQPARFDFGAHGRPGAHHHVRLGRPGDMARLARLMTGRATGLVLAGGGARGFAHIGAIKALREAGVVFDMAGGASMGAIVAAGVAMEWDDAELRQRMYDSFVRSNPLNDVTLPVVALFRGAKVAKLLRSHFGEMGIEDLPLPYYCMTSDLTAGAAVAHRHGKLWRALRASVAIPGLLSPVVYNGHLHVDGGIMNNLPVDVMADESRGPVIAIDVAGDWGFTVKDEAYGDENWYRAVKRSFTRAPGLVSILMRTGTVGNETQRRFARAQADLIIDPELDGIGLKSWKKFDCAVEAGYRAVATQIERDGLPEALRNAA